ncbi:hypothetical protein MKX50_03760 [Paenibacillus sp. FSL W8-0186]|uniref:hypothetical protein n=1 Tax=Paenibacillus sp. FSL W8-0186 TaxID=2921709 RepID=UPI0030D57817
MGDHDKKDRKNRNYIDEPKADVGKESKAANLYRPENLGAAGMAAAFYAFVRIHSTGSPYLNGFLAVSFCVKKGGADLSGFHVIKRRRIANMDWILDFRCIRSI